MGGLGSFGDNNYGVWIWGLILALVSMLWGVCIGEYTN